MQEPGLTAKLPRKCLFQDLWLKDSAYQEWILKDKLDKHYAWCVACEIRLIFCVFLTVVMVLTKSNIGPFKSLYGPYLALVQLHVPGNHVSGGLPLPCAQAVSDEQATVDGSHCWRAAASTEDDGAGSVGGYLMLYVWCEWHPLDFHQTLDTKQMIRLDIVWELPYVPIATDRIGHCLRGPSSGLGP